MPLTSGLSESDDVAAGFGTESDARYAVLADEVLASVSECADPEGTRSQLAHACLHPDARSPLSSRYA